LFRHSEVAISTAEQVAGLLACPHEELPEAMLVLERLPIKYAKLRLMALVGLCTTNSKKQPVA
jgi:hypothetical protein